LGRVSVTPCFSRPIAPPTIVPQPLDDLMNSLQLFRRAAWLAAVACVIASNPSLASEPTGPFTAKPLAEAAPDELAAPIRASLADQGTQILDGAGKPYMSLWFRKSLPLVEAFDGPQGNILLPGVTIGELIGAVHFPEEWIDYRDQLIEPGTYTIRYAHHPVDGNHQDVSPYRDFLLLVPAKLDQTTEPFGLDDLNKKSAESTGSSHPSVLPLVPAGDPVPQPTTLEDAAHATWSLTLGLPAVAGQAKTPTTIPIRFIIFGVGH